MKNYETKTYKEALEKAKAYDEALERARNIHRNYKGRVRAVDVVIEEVFPKLEEDGDERIRKGLINYFNDFTLPTFGGLDPKKILAWLEKQGDISPTEDELEALRIAAYEPIKNWSEKLQSLYEKLVYCEYKPADKVETKFHKGEWITHNTANFVFKIINFGTNGYEVINRENFKKTISFDNEENYHLWTIQDAKDGDVLASNRSIFIFSQEYIAGKPEAHCGIMNGLFLVKPEGCWTNEKCYPATKKQRALLFKKMKEAGYEWDAEKKELKKIEQKPVFEIKTPEESLGISSEEYNKIVDECIYGEQKPVDVRTTGYWHVEDVGQNLAWSEEDESYLNTTIAYLKDAKEFKKTAENCIDWLKSLKDRYTWKPSDEQMDALRYVTNFDYGGHKATLVLLYEQLKKLRDE